MICICVYSYLPVPSPLLRISLFFVESPDIFLWVSIEIFHQGLAWYFPVSTGIDTLLQPLKGNHATQGKLFERRPYLSGNTAKFLNERNMYLSFWKIMPIRPQGRGWEGNQLP